ncbi:MAG: hypothetical protein JWR63_1909, partial [Conexibacter sp.]|nr:hypothetical protein [Conexibacter sp.]
DADVLAQAAAQRAVASAVAVPRVRWEEADPEPLGAPFFVMDHVEGRVPSTAPTFHAAGWVTELDPGSRHDLAVNGLRSLAAINRLEGPEFAGLQADGPGAAGLERYLGWVERWASWASDGDVPELIASALVELRGGRPDRQETAVSWGDCRPGNMLFGPDLGVRAVLDWELVTLGPPELDLGWWLMMDRWSTDGFGVAPLPGWPTRAETIDVYAGFLGRPVRDVAYFELLAATRYAVIGVRSTNMLIAAGVLPRDTAMGTNNQVTQLLAELMGRPIPELSRDLARVMAALSAP